MHHSGGDGGNLEEDDDDDGDGDDDGNECKHEEVCNRLFGGSTQIDFCPLCK
jgi:hypothetical protein